MKTFVLLLTALAVAAVPAFGTLGSVVGSFAAPGNYPIALARATSYHFMWVYCNTPPFNIWHINAYSGSVYNSYVSPREEYTRGLTYEWGGLLYIGDYLTEYVYKCAYASGSVKSSFELRHDLYGGLALQCDAGGQNPAALFSDCNTPLYVWRENHETGDIYSSFTPAVTLYDLAWDYENELLWGGDMYSDTVYGYDAHGSLVSSFKGPAYYPLGMCYYGEYLWISTTSGSHRIWRVHCPAGLDAATNVTPTSAGKIKALFH